MIKQRAGANTKANEVYNTLKRDLFKVNCRSYGPGCGFASQFKLGRHTKVPLGYQSH